MTHHHADWPMFAAAVVIGAIGVAALLIAFCAHPEPVPPVVLSTPTLPVATPLPTPAPTITSMIVVPAVQATATLLPPAPSVVSVPTTIAPTETRTPNDVRPSPTAIFKPKPAPVQIPDKG